MADTKDYVSPTGSYKKPYGGFSAGNPAIPGDAVEVSGPPEHGTQLWDNVAESWYHTKAHLGEHLAEYRWRKETGGIVFNALNIPTGDRDNAKDLGGADCLEPAEVGQNRLVGHGEVLVRVADALRVTDRDDSTEHPSIGEWTLSRRSGPRVF